MAQLRSSGVLGTVKIRKAGYPRYRVLALAEGKGGDIPLAEALKGSQLICNEVLGWGMELVQMGKSRVFMKARAYIEIEKAKKVALG
eukprot:gene38470-39002_t